MYIHRSKGFTLIELLVVIAIIGVLSSVVLASLNTARVKGNNAAIQSNLATVQTQAEVYYGTANTYGSTVTACTGGMFLDNNISKAIAAAKATNGGVDLACFSDGQIYGVSSKKAGSDTGYWCIDSLGNTGSRASAATAAGCPAS